MSTLVYVYAIAPTAVPVEGVRWVPHEGLSAAVSDVPEAEYNEQALNANIADMQWLGPKAIAHQDINQRLHDASDALVPLAFGTVFTDDGRVKAMLREQAAGLREQLERVRGCSEWVVAVHRTAAPDANSSTHVQELKKEIEVAPPGRAHLLRKRLTEVEREATRELEHDAAQRILDVLQRVAADVYVEPLPSEVAERPLLRASVLVPRTDEGAFIKQVERLSDQWLQVQLTGPWPAYRFGGLRHEHAAA